MKERSTDSQSKNGKKKNGENKKHLVRYVTILAIIIILGFVGTVTTIAYTDFKPPFVNSEIAKRVKIYFAFMPLLPKTKEQVLFSSVYKSSQMKSFSVESSGTLNISLPSLPFKIYINEIHYVDYSDKKKPKTFSEGNLIINYLGTEYDFKLKIILMDNNVYIKFDKIPNNLISFLVEYFNELDIYVNEDLLNSLVDTLTSSWIKLNKKTNNFAREELNKDKNSFYKTLLETLDSNVLKKVNFSKDKENYKLSITLSDKEVIEFQKKFLLKKEKNLTSSQKKLEFLDNLKKNIKEIKITSDIGKKDYYVKNIVFTFKTDLNQIEGIRKSIQSNPFMSDLKIEGKFIWKFTDINKKKKEIKIPENYRNIEEIFFEFQKKTYNFYNSLYNSYNFYNPYNHTLKSNFIN